jgi:hypothetical protein
MVKTVQGKKRTRHFNTLNPSILLILSKQVIQIRCCPTQVMVADYMRKPLVRAKFDAFRNEIMKFAIPVTQNTNLVGQNECIGKVK